MATGRGGLSALGEPWYQIAKAVALPPVRLWFDLRVEGLEHVPASGPALIACNHLSYLDPLTNAQAVVDAGRRPRFLAKQELFDIPVVGTALRGAGQIPVRRGTGGARLLHRAEAALEAGETLVVYPEGTVTAREDHLPMRGKTGIVRLAVATELSVIPLASWGSQAVWQKSGRGSLKYGRPVLTRIGPPIVLGPVDVADHDAIREATAIVMDALTAMAIELRDAYPPRWSR